MKKILDAAVTYDFTIGHLDVSHYVNKETCKIEDEDKIAKIDKWCDRVFNHVSVNGLCVVVFTGPKTLPKDVSVNNNLGELNSSKIMNSSESSENSPKKENGSSSIESGKNGSSESSESKTLQHNQARRNGVCFVRINSLQNKVK